MAARRRHAGEARHGHRARRGAGDDGAGQVWRWRQAGAADKAAASAIAGEATRHDVPDWLKRKAPAEATAPRQISPSGALAAKFADAKALTRGRVVHRLLQALPAL